MVGGWEGAEKENGDGVEGERWFEWCWVEGWFFGEGVILISGLLRCLSSPRFCLRSVYGSDYDYSTVSIVRRDQYMPVHCV